MGQKDDMSVVREKITASLVGFGYGVSDSHGEMRAAIASNTIMWKVRNANPKRFEVYVTGQRQDEFLVPTHRNDRGDWEAFERFGKDDRGVGLFIEWLSKVKQSHSHLREILHPETLPPPFAFQAGEFTQDDEYMVGGQVSRCRVSDIVSIDGVWMVPGASAPGVIPWFLTKLQVFSGEITIITDGDHWYPIIHTATNGEWRVLISHGGIGTLREMNQRDKRLISAAIRSYAEKVTSKDDK